MEPDLMPCPVCGKAVFENHSEVFCGDELCVYMTATVDLHNTLARRAEIGRLVEKSCGGTLDGPLKIFPNTVGQWTVSLQSYSQGVLRVSGDTLLDALRALEAEVGGRDEPEGGPAL